MKTAVILASGPSLNDDDIGVIHRARIERKVDTVIAVSDVGLLKATWADALASHDSRWWTAHERETLDFKGRKFSSRGYQRTEQYSLRGAGLNTSVNSGAFAMYVARDVFEVERIILLGFDLHRRNGAHFFGEHIANANGATLTNTNERKFGIHIKQFNAFTGCEVINCTMGSDLKKFPIIPLRDILHV